MTMTEEIRVNRVTITLIVFLLAQAVLGIIWGARLDANVSALASLAELNRVSLVSQLDKLEASINTGMQFRYTSGDAARDKDMGLRLLEAINKRIDLNEKRIERLESKP